MNSARYRQKYFINVGNYAVSHPPSGSLRNRKFLRQPGLCLLYQRPRPERKGKRTAAKLKSAALGESSLRTLSYRHKTLASRGFRVVAGLRPPSVGLTPAPRCVSRRCKAATPRASRRFAEPTPISRLARAQSFALPSSPSALARLWPPSPGISSIFLPEWQTGNQFWIITVRAKPGGVRGLRFCRRRLGGLS